MNIYVGNLPAEVTEEDLKHAFEEFGTVEKVKIIKDWQSGESRGFGFVEMPKIEEAEAAIENLNGKELQNNVINVSKARSRGEKRRGDQKPGGNRSSGIYRGDTRRDSRRFK